MKIKSTKGGFQVHNPDISKELPPIKVVGEKRVLARITDNNKKCAPGVEKDNISCFTLNQIKYIVDAYNQTYPENMIKLSRGAEASNSKEYKKYLITELNKRFEKVCNYDQQCLLNQDFIEKIDKKVLVELVNDTFRPEGPKTGNKWLNTLNIEEVMGQYTNNSPNLKLLKGGINMNYGESKKHNDFIFLGAVPIDFDDEKVGKIDPRCKFIQEITNNYDNLKKLYDMNIYKLGIIFNLDKHNQSGSHWVACYADLKAGCIYYFDSYGIRPPQLIQKYIRKLGRFIKDVLGNNNCIIDYNSFRHQYENSECGVYSLFFIIFLLLGNNFNDLNSVHTPDGEINKFREFLFS
jgi:hypothetical protein